MKTMKEMSTLTRSSENSGNSESYRACPLCGRNELEIVSESPAIVRCLRCHHGFRPDPEESIVRGYAGFVNMPTYFEAKMFARHHYDFIERNIGFDNISNILEIGSGDGAFLKLIRKKNPRIKLAAIEASVDLCRGLRKIPDLTVINSYIEEVSPAGKFDLVVMSHVLEHLEKPRDVLKNIHDNYLDPGGYLYIDVPNQDFELSSPRMASMAPDTHLFFFNGKHFQNNLTEAGFHAENITGAKYSTIPQGYITRMEIISGLANSKNLFDKIKLYRVKAMKKISLMASAPIRVLQKRNPKEIALDRTGDNYNNMAILARK